ncbi:MAG TPA: SDR family NAD(P)-dependent oxidoreductase [Rhodopila sp.]|uniref:SDR family NAD(P)-dependent oxidoreductase n=1 Tax=Rhodopila sp. TaxID=2480087 RepID=UPI002BE3AD15|nr:SDR family NAD(P)-dependent oxidoreductase [Rhodopila sp.]HVY16639.1 SDR family NAD(P)-dependent oxidoreductase [Rhodopila sp.]
MLQGQTGIVTGPAKGMGAAVSLTLAEAGADLILLGRDTAAIEPVAADIRALGRRAEIAGCDVTSETEVAAAITRPVDFLVNVAGGSGPLGRPIWENTLAEFEQIMTLNVTGCFLTMRAVLPGMIARRRGRIVNIGGTFGLRGRAGRAAYSASKWGLRGLTKSAALEAGPYGVTVNCVCPGMVEGERFDRVRTEMGARLGITPDEARDRMASEYALRRISTDQDVAGAVLFLLGDAARQVTGQDIAVDGGWVI